MFWPDLLRLRAQVHSIAGMPDRALELIEEALSIGGPRDLTNPEFHIVKGDVLRSFPDPDREAAETSYLTAAHGAGAGGFYLVELQALTRLVGLRRETGTTPDGSNELANLYATFTEGLDEYDLVAAGGAGRDIILNYVCRHTLAALAIQPRVAHPRPKEKVMRRATKRRGVFASTLVLLLTALAVGPAAAANQAASQQGASITSQSFGVIDADGHPEDGKEVFLYTLTNRKGMRVNILTYGGILQSIEIPGRRRVSPTSRWASTISISTSTRTPTSETSPGVTPTGLPWDSSR